MACSSAGRDFGELVAVDIISDSLPFCSNIIAFIRSQQVGSISVYVCWLRGYGKS